jgi:hypothetical protein
MLLEVLVAHAIEPPAALKLLGVNVTRALRAARPSGSTRPRVSSSRRRQRDFHGGSRSAKRSVKREKQFRRA